MTDRYEWGRGHPGSPQGRPASREGDRLVQALREHSAITAWTTTETAGRGHQLYLAGRTLESIRTTESGVLRAVIHVRSGDAMGTARLSLALGDDLRARVEDAVRVARQGESKPYALAPLANLPTVQTVDPQLASRPEEALLELREQLLAKVARESRVRLASGEFHAVVEESIFRTSEGLVAHMPGTLLTSELVLIGEDGRGREAEVQDLRRRRRIEDLELGPLIARLSEEARDASTARPMRDYHGAVVLWADDLNSYFRPILGQTSYESAWRRTSIWEIGDSVGGGTPRGDALTLTGDPTLPFGTATVACDGEGTPAQAATIVREGRFVRQWGDQANAQYLGKSATGDFGNMVIDAGSAGASELFAGSDVLEVRRFSWLTPSGRTGDYSSEIRFGYHHRNGQRTPIRGGSLIGNVFTSVLNCRMDRDTHFVGNGRVPRRIRFDGLRVAGVEAGA